MMTCSKCESENVTVSMNQVSGKTKTKNVSILAKLGRWTLIIFTMGLWILIPKRKATSNTKFKTEKLAICQDCGNSWKIK